MKPRTIICLSIPLILLSSCGGSATADKALSNLNLGEKYHSYRSINVKVNGETTGYLSEYYSFNEGGTGIRRVHYVYEYISSDKIGVSHYTTNITWYVSETGYLYIHSNSADSVLDSDDDDYGTSSDDFNIYLATFDIGDYAITGVNNDNIYYCSSYLSSLNLGVDFS